MALVRVTGNAWDHNRAVIPAESRPRLWFRPVSATVTMSGSLQTGDSVQAWLDSASGRFAVELESDPAIRYQPWMDRIAPGLESEPAGDRARTVVVWPFTFPAGAGGDIQDLIPVEPTAAGIIVALGPPPEGTTGVVWIDLTDTSSEGALVYGPERT